MSGLDENGFSRSTLADEKTEIESALKTKLGKATNTQAGSVFSQIIGIVSERLALLWEALEDAYNSQYPDTAEGASLDNVVAMNGIARQAATKSTVNLNLYGDEGTIIEAGKIFSVANNSQSRFISQADVELVAGQDEIQKIEWPSAPSSGVYKIKYREETTIALDYDAPASAIEAALNGLDLLSEVSVTGGYGSQFFIFFEGADGKTDHQLISIVDNTTGLAPTASTFQDGVNQGFVACIAESTGPFEALAGTLTVIETPVNGLDSVKNWADAVVGRNRETDIELRERRSNTLSSTASSTIEAIRSALLNVVGVTNVVMFENQTGSVDGNGLPAKSFKAVVNGGEDQDIGDTIWNKKPAGIESFGDEEVVVEDSSGNNQSVFFGRPVEVSIYITITLTTDSDYPADGDELVEEALVNYINALTIGQDVVVYPKLIGAIDAIPGITDLAIAVGTAPGPTLDNNIEISAEQIARTDTLKVVVS